MGGYQLRNGADFFDKLSLDRSVEYADGYERYINVGN